MSEKVYTVAAVGRALGVPDARLYGMLRGPDKRYLLPGGRNMPHFLPSLAAVGACVLLGGILKPSQRVALIEAAQSGPWKEFLFRPQPDLVFLEVPANGLDPKFRMGAPAWNSVSFDLGAFTLGLRDEMDRIANENPSWARTHARDVAGAEFVPDTKGGKARSEKAAKKLVANSLRDLVERG